MAYLMNPTSHFKILKIEIDHKDLDVCCVDYDLL